MKNPIAKLFEKSFLKKNDKSFYGTLLFSFFIVSITSTLVLSVFLAVNFLNSIASSAKNYNQQLLAQTNYAIDQVNESTDRLTVSLLSNDNISAFLSLTSDNNTTAPVLASHEIDKQLMVLPYIDSIYLYNASLDLLYCSENGYQQAPGNYDEQEIIKRLHNKDFRATYKGGPIPSGKNADSTSSKYFSYYIFDSHSSSSSKMNAIIININSSILTDSIQSMKRFTSENESSFLLLDQNKNYLTGVLSDSVSKDMLWVDSALKALSSQNAFKSSYIKVDGTTYFLTHTNSNLYGWNLLSFTPVNILFKNILTTALISSLILVAVLIMTWMICRRFAQRLNEPLEDLTQLLKSKRFISKEQTTSEVEEFQTILSSVSSLQKNNQQLHSVQQKTKYSLTQSCLNDLVLNHHVDSPDLVRQKLRHLDLGYLDKDKLFMTVFKIDNYQKFLKEHTSDELWVVRFSVVNIIEELASELSASVGFSRDNDKFVLLVTCNPDEDIVAFEDKLVLLIQSIQKNIEAYLHFTMTAAYSTIFRGLNRFPAVYKNLEQSLLLKLRYGHNAIIDPYQIDEVQTEAFQLPYRLMNQLIDRLTNGQLEEAWSIYENVTQNLFLCDYNDVMSTLLHMAHSVYERLPERYPMLKDSVTDELKTFLSGLETAEISDDIQKLTRTYFEKICSSVQKLKEDPLQQSSSVVAERITQIIQDNFSNPALCLCSIAEEIGLSSNYTGHIFKQYTQKSVSQYILEVRMEQIAYYLQTTSLPLSKILEKVGMEKSNYFYTRFKNYFGMSLGEYKQTIQNNSETTES